MSEDTGMFNNMTPPIKLHISKEPLNLDSFRSYALSRISHDWYGQDPRIDARFALAVDDKKIWFRSIVDYQNTRPHFSELPAGMFTEELWKQDVAELFLLDPVSGYYQEFNFAPSGAWWSQVFSSYRSPAPDSYKVFSLASHETQIENNTWENVVALNKNDLSIDTSNIFDLRGTIAFIMGSPEQEFISWHTTRNAEPDYHLIKEYAAFSRIEL